MLIFNGNKVWQFLTILGHRSNWNWDSRIKSVSVIVLFFTAKNCPPWGNTTGNCIYPHIATECFAKRGALWIVIR